VPDNLCETQMPPQIDLGNGHTMKCHLSDANLAEMEHVIKFNTNKQAS